MRAFMKQPAILCAAMIALFASTAWLAVQTKSPAYDEPYHAISAWVQLHFHDYRIDNEDPPLWQYWAALPNGHDAIKADVHGPLWDSLTRSIVRQWYWGVQTLFRTPGNNATLFINRSRAMMLVWSIMLGGLICRWSWKIGGPLAAIFAVIPFCLDPNFLAHAALMKNDCAFALSLFALAYSLWKAGQNLTGPAIASIAFCCIITLTVKFSGLIAVMLVPILLLLRAISTDVWPVLGRTVSSRAGRVGIAAIITAFAMAISYLGIWAVYGFRFQPTPQADVWLNLDELVQQTRINAYLEQHQNQPRPVMLPDAPLQPAVKCALFANQHGLLPQAFIAGFLFTYANAMIRVAYLCGNLSPVGWWWYFPFAILVKTPVITLLAAAFTAVQIFRSRRMNHLWTPICLIVPPVMFLGSAMASHLNIGIRHVLAIYPFVFVAMGWAANQVWSRNGKKARRTLVIAGLLLSLESLSAFPDFLSYFNVIAAHSPGGKLALLGDSNLDWGQDLPLLAQWQHENPDRPLYLCYFGYADPAYYGIHYTPLPGGYHYDPPPHFPDPYTPSVVAISATNLQGILLDDTLKKYYASWAKRKPREILGGSVYLYDYDPLQR